MTSIRKIYKGSKKKSKNLINSLLDYDLNKLTFLKRALILCLLVPLTVLIIFYGIFLPIAFLSEEAHIAQPIIILVCLFPSYYLIKKISFNIKMLIREYREK